LFHPPEEVQVLFYRPLAVNARPAGFGQRSAQTPHLLRVRAIHIGQARLDEVPREFVEPLEIVGGMVKMRSPVVTEPMHRILDRFLVLHVLLDGVRVVEAQVAHATVLRGESEIETDRLRVTDMQVAIGLRGKASNDSAAVLTGAKILGNDLPEKVRAWRSLRLRRCSSHHALFMNKQWSSAILVAGVAGVIEQHARG